MTITITTGAVIYRGPSELNGSPIVAILLAGESNNGKIVAQYDETGNKLPARDRRALQTVILPDLPIPATHARSQGRDGGPCGGCGMAGMRGCYVTSMFISSVDKAWRNGRYSDATGEGMLRTVGPWWEQVGQALETKGRYYQLLRHGAYGDPLALPDAVLERLARLADYLQLGETGYTHQWRSMPARARKYGLMASTETDAGWDAALALGLRPYHVSADGKAPGKATRCPSQLDGTSCSECLMCHGPGAPIVAATHGSGAARVNAAAARANAARA